MQNIYYNNNNHFYYDVVVFSPVLGLYKTTVSTPTSWGELFLLLAVDLSHTQTSRPMSPGHYTFVEFGLPRTYYVPSLLTPLMQYQCY